LFPGRQWGSGGNVGSGGMNPPGGVGRNPCSIYGCGDDGWNSPGGIGGGGGFTFRPPPPGSGNGAFSFRPPPPGMGGS